MIDDRARARDALAKIAQASGLLSEACAQMRDHPRRMEIAEMLSELTLIAHELADDQPASRGGGDRHDTL